MNGRPRFVWFPGDEVLVKVDDIVTVRVLSEGDFDARTGQLLRTIPEGAQTRIDLGQGLGWVWLSQPIRTVVETIREAVEQ